MAALAILPAVGATLIWAPAAIWLVLSGSWVKGVILALRGMEGRRPLPPRLYGRPSLGARTQLRRFVRRALGQCGGDRAATSQMLGISARSLRYLIRKHRLKDEPAGDKN